MEAFSGLRFIYLNELLSKNLGLGEAKDRERRGDAARR